MRKGRGRAERGRGGCEAFCAEQPDLPRGAIPVIQKKTGMYLPIIPVSGFSIAQYSNVFWISVNYP